jgi:AraC-like DNA-binding protein
MFLPVVILQNILTYYANMPCFLILAGDWKTWHTVIMASRKRPTPIDFESPKQWRERTRYNLRALLAVARTKRACCTSHQGLYGLFVPIMKNGRCLGALQTGVFLTQAPTEASLTAQWQKLMGRSITPHDSGYLDYASSVISTPVLDAPLVEGLRELLELFGAYLSGALETRAVAAKMQALQIGLFSRRLWHHQWVEWQVVRPRFFRGDVDPKKLMRWEREELGIQRFPTVVLAAKREGTGREGADRVAAADFQREALQLAREMDEALGHPLENFGALLLTSPTPGLSSAEAEGELRRKAEAFARQLSQRLHCRVWVGVGRISGGEVSLHNSYQEAVAALHLAVTRNQDIVFYRDLPRIDLSETAMRHRISEFIAAIFDQGRAPASHHRDVFVQDLLIMTRSRPEATRRVLMETLHHLFAALEARRDVDPASLMELETRTTLEIETALNVNEMVGRFGGAFEQLLSFLEMPATGDRLLRLQKASESIRASLHERWTLPMAARRFGFSKTTFSREFTRYIGLPFSEFILSQRIEKAKRLLGSELSLKEVADACGFQSVTYFQQIFKRKAGLPPGVFRSRKLG